MGMQKGQKKGANSRIGFLAQSGQKNIGGKFNPTDKDRNDVELMSAYGLPQRVIASVLKITTMTLSRHFQYELDCGLHLKNNRVAKSLYMAAVKDGNVAAQMFWLRCRAGWRSNDEVPVAPLPPPQVDYSKLTVSELKNLQELLSKAASNTIDITPGKVPAISNNGKVHVNGHGN